MKAAQFTVIAKLSVMHNFFLDLSAKWKDKNSCACLDSTLVQDQAECWYLFWKKYIFIEIYFNQDAPPLIYV